MHEEHRLVLTFSNYLDYFERCAELLAATSWQRFMQPLVFRTNTFPATADAGVRRLALRLLTYANLG